MYVSKTQASKPITVSALARMKDKGEKIAMLTCYDAGFAVHVDEAGTDVVLVGDSLGMVIQGHDTTVPVTVDQMIYHSQCVARGLHRALLLVDMPFLSYPSPAVALENARRLMQEGGARMVKLEGDVLQTETVRYLADRGVPVCAHLGLRPQSVHKMGGYKIQGRTDEAAAKMIEDARTLEDAGADMLLLECVPGAVAEAIRRAVRVPVIGIGAGAQCDGQVLVLYDILGITPGKLPRFAQDFCRGEMNFAEAIRAYVTAVKADRFPGPEHGFG